MAIKTATNTTLKPLHVYTSEVSIDRLYSMLQSETHYFLFRTGVLYLNQNGMVELDYIPFQTFAPYRFSIRTKSVNRESLKALVEKAYMKYLNLTLAGEYDTYMMSEFGSMYWEHLPGYLYEDIPNKYSYDWIKCIYKQAQLNIGIPAEHFYSDIPDYIVEDFQNVFKNIDYVEEILHDMSFEVSTLSKLLKSDYFDLFQDTHLYLNHMLWLKGVEDIIVREFGFRCDPREFVEQGMKRKFVYSYSLSLELKRGLLLGYI